MALIGGLGWLAHRVSVERDIESLSRVLPPVAAPVADVAPDMDAAPPVPASLPAAPAAQAAAPHTPDAADAAVPAGASGAGAPPAAAPPDGRSSTVSGAGQSEVKAPVTKRRVAGIENGRAEAPPKQTRRVQREGARQQSAMAGKPAKRKRPSESERQRSIALQMHFSEIFRRCPQPGQPGAVECRRHICNGAESEGPACKPYRGKLR